MRTPRYGSGIVLAAASCLLGPGPRAAPAQLLGPELQVNTYTTGRQEEPEVAADASGNFVVVWQSWEQDGSDSGVFARRFDSAGGPVGNEFQVSSYTTSVQGYPAVAADGVGRFLVVWYSFGQAGGLNYDVFGQRYDSAGAPAGSEFMVNSYTTNQQRDPSAAADGSGNFVVVWQSYFQGGDAGDVFGQRYDSEGDPVGSEFLVNSSTTSAEAIPQVAANSAGDFVVVWQALNQDGSSFGIFGQRFDSAGDPVGSELEVNSYTTGFQGVSSVAVDDTGRFIVAWQGDGDDASGSGVFGRRFDSAGDPVGSDFRINSYTTADQRNPRVAADPSGDFVVIWYSEGQDGSLDGVFGQRFDSAGRRVGSELQVNSSTAASQRFPAVAAAGPGDFVVAWQSNLQDGEDLGVFARQLAWLFADGFEDGTVCAWSSAVGAGDC